MSCLSGKQHQFVFCTGLWAASANFLPSSPGLFFLFPCKNIRYLARKSNSSMLRTVVPTAPGTKVLRRPGGAEANDSDSSSSSHRSGCSAARGPSAGNLSPPSPKHPKTSNLLTLRRGNPSSSTPRSGESGWWPLGSKQAGLPAGWAAEKAYFQRLKLCPACCWRARSQSRQRSKSQKHRALLKEREIVCLSTHKTTRA